VAGIEMKVRRPDFLIIVAIILLLIFNAGITGEVMASESGTVAVVAELLPAMKIGSFTGVKNVEIIYGVREHESERGAVIVVNGRNETFVKYSEVIDELSNLGFSVYTMDHRGQGFSGRQLEDPQKGHVDTYDDYIADFDHFIKNVVNAKPHRVKLVVAHSMGGTISLLYELRHPGSFSGIVMSAPMLGFSTSPWPFFLVPPMLALYEVLGLERSYVVGGGKFDLEPYSPDNILTSDEAHYTQNYQLMLDYPQTQLGAPTCAWVKKSLEAIKEIQDGAGKFKLPLLILQAEDDRVVNNCAEDSFCREVGENCRLVVMPGPQHEILMEKPVIRENAEKLIADFLLRLSAQPTE
jgi:lysophospholipase